MLSRDVIEQSMREPAGGRLVGYRRERDGPEDQEGRGFGQNVQSLGRGIEKAAK